MLDYQEVINKMVIKGQEKARSLRRTRALMKEIVEKYKMEAWNCYFCTFTFKDIYLPFNRKQFVDYLSKTCKVHVVLYCDYGKINNRFHLHGYIFTKKSLDLTNDYFNKFGWTKLEDIKCNNIDYVVKYSVKFNFKSFRMIYVKPKNHI